MNVLWTQEEYDSMIKGKFISFDYSFQFIHKGLQLSQFESNTIFQVKTTKPFLPDFN